MKPKRKRTLTSVVSWVTRLYFTLSSLLRWLCSCSSSVDCIYFCRCHSVPTTKENEKQKSLWLVLYCLHFSFFLLHFFCLLRNKGTSLNQLNSEQNRAEHKSERTRCTRAMLMVMDLLDYGWFLSLSLLLLRCLTFFFLLLLLFSNSILPSLRRCSLKHNTYMNSSLIRLLGWIFLIIGW